MQQTFDITLSVTIPSQAMREITQASPFSGPIDAVKHIREVMRRTTPAYGSLLMSKKIMEHLRAVGLITTDHDAKARAAALEAARTLTEQDKIFLGASPFADEVLAAEALNLVVRNRTGTGLDTLSLLAITQELHEDGVLTIKDRPAAA